MYSSCRANPFYIIEAHHVLTMCIHEAQNELQQCRPQISITELTFQRAHTNTFSIERIMLMWACTVFRCTIWFFYHGELENALNGGSNGKIICKWAIFYIIHVLSHKNQGANTHDCQQTAHVEQQSWITSNISSTHVNGSRIEKNKQSHSSMNMHSLSTNA